MTEYYSAYIPSHEHTQSEADYLAVFVTIKLTTLWPSPFSDSTKEECVHCPDPLLHLILPSLFEILLKWFRITTDHHQHPALLKTQW